MATVWYPNGTPAGAFKTVKDVGWLLRHRKDGIDRVEVKHRGQGAALEVGLENSKIFYATFSSLKACYEWVQKYLLAGGWVKPDRVDERNMVELRLVLFGIEPQPKPLPYFHPREP